MAAAGGSKQTNVFAYSGDDSKLTGWQNDNDDDDFTTGVHHKYATRSSLSSLSPPRSPDSTPPPPTTTASSVITSQENQQQKLPPPHDSNSRRGHSIKTKPAQSGANSEANGSNSSLKPQHCNNQSNTSRSSTIADAIHRFRHMPPMPRDKRQQGGSAVSTETADSQFWWQKPSKRNQNEETKEFYDHRAKNAASQSTSVDTYQPRCTHDKAKDTKKAERTYSTTHQRCGHWNAYDSTDKENIRQFGDEDRNQKIRDSLRQSTSSNTWSTRSHNRTGGKDRPKSIESSPARKSLEEEADAVFRRWLGNQNGVLNQKDHDHSKLEDNFDEESWEESLSGDIKDAGRLDVVGLYRDITANSKSFHRKKSGEKSKQKQRKPQSAVAIAEDLTYTFRALMSNRHRDQGDSEVTYPQMTSHATYYGTNNPLLDGDDDEEDYDRTSLLKKVMNSLDISVKRYRHLVPSSEKARERRKAKQAERAKLEEKDDSSSDSSLKSSKSAGYWFRKRASKIRDIRRPRNRRRSHGDDYSIHGGVPVEGLAFGVRMSAQLENPGAVEGEHSELHYFDADNRVNDSLSSLRQAIHEAGMLTPPPKQPPLEIIGRKENEELKSIREKWKQRGCKEEKNDNSNKSQEEETEELHKIRPFRWTDLAFDGISDKPERCLQFLSSQKAHQNNEQDGEKPDTSKDEAETSTGQKENPDNHENKGSSGNGEKESSNNEDDKKEEKLPVASFFQTLPAQVAMDTYKPVFNYSYPTTIPRGGINALAFRKLANLQTENWSPQEQPEMGNVQISNVTRYDHWDHEDESENVSNDENLFKLNYSRQARSQGNQGHSRQRQYYRSNNTNFDTGSRTFDRVSTIPPKKLLEEKQFSLSSSRVKNPDISFPGKSSVWNKRSMYQPYNLPTGELKPAEQKSVAAFNHMQQSYGGAGTSHLAMTNPRHPSGTSNWHYTRVNEASRSVSPIAPSGQSTPESFPRFLSPLEGTTGLDSRETHSSRTSTKKDHRAVASFQPHALEEHVIPKDAFVRNDQDNHPARGFSGTTPKEKEYVSRAHQFLSTSRRMRQQIESQLLAGRPS